MINGGATAIMVYKALNTEGMTLTFTSSGGATIPFNYLAHQPDPNDVQFAPFHIWFVELPDGGVAGLGGGITGAAAMFTSPIDGMTIAQMTDYAAENGIVIPEGVTKHADICNTINEALGYSGENAANIKIDS
jgi:hypothetical protein